MYTYIMETLTRDKIKELFIEYNKLYFNNEIPMPKFSVFNNYSCNGFCTINEKNTRIWISSKVEWDEEGLKDVLIHEMIHLYVTIVQGHYIWGKIFAHGFLFKRILYKIRKMGVNVSLRSAKVYFKNEKIPTTTIGRVRRYIFGPIF